MCPSEESCRLVDNISKPKEDPKIDFILKIRPVQQLKPLMNKFIQQQVNQQQQPEPLMKQKFETIPQVLNKQLETCLLDKISSPENKCPINQVCLIKDKLPVCVCPEELNLRLIDGICREVYDSMVGCTMYLNECTVRPNEECVALNSFSKHGTCQCKLGFRRNTENPNFLCESEKIVLENNNLAKTQNNRRRPPLNFDDSTNFNTNNNNKNNDNHDDGSHQGIIKNVNEKSFEPLIQEIYDELSKEANLKNENKPDKIEEPESIIKYTEPIVASHQELLQSSTKAKQSESSSILTTTIERTTKTYEPPSLYTESLKANAGRDIHVYYPSTMCILNGSLTDIFSKNPSEYYITKWEWIKLETSPAFGVNFLQ